MSKPLDLSKSVYELTTQYPELIEIMRDLGFTEIVKPGMLQSVGRIMTIPKGAKMRKINMIKVVTTLMMKGFNLVGERPKSSYENHEPMTEKQVIQAAKDARTSKLKSYLKRLGEGEDLEVIREEFRRNFSDVEASEIMRAEQEMMQEGTPLEEVQRLCDVHSALFHGATREERIANTEVEVAASLEREHLREEAEQNHAIAAQANEEAARLVATIGHPLHTFTRENRALRILLDESFKALDNGLLPDVERLRQVAIHYAKKGDLIYPNLKVRYGITGPANVMWTVDDEIRDTLGRLSKSVEKDNTWQMELRQVLKRADEMIYKETNILFPICAKNFTQAEWIGIYRDSQDYSDCLEVHPDKWAEADEAPELQHYDNGNGEIVMRGGHLTVEQLSAMLNAIPLEISFVDADNINRYFNEGEKVFKRPGMAIDREVFSCHPPKIEPIVRAIIDDFRNGVRDSVPVWMEKNGHTMLVNYMAVRDHKGKYLGTMEIVQDMENIRQHFVG